MVKSDQCLQLFSSRRQLPLLVVPGFFYERHEMEHNYNPGENSKQSCGKTEISKVDADKYNLVFNTTWKYRGKTTSKPYKQCKMSVAACIEAASYWSGFRPCCMKCATKSI